MVGGQDIYSSIRSPRANGAIGGAADRTGDRQRGYGYRAGRLTTCGTDVCWAFRRPCTHQTPRKSKGLSVAVCQPGEAREGAGGQRPNHRVAGLTHRATGTRRSCTHPRSRQRRRSPTRCTWCETGSRRRSRRHNSQACHVIVKNQNQSN